MFDFFQQPSRTERIPVAWSPVRSSGGRACRRQRPLRHDRLPTLSHPEEGAAAGVMWKLRRKLL